MPTDPFANPYPEEPVSREEREKITQIFPQLGEEPQVRAEPAPIAEPKAEPKFEEPLLPPRQPTHPDLQRVFEKFETETPSNEPKVEDVLPSNEEEDEVDFSGLKRGIIGIAGFIIFLGLAAGGIWYFVSDDSVLIKAETGGTVEFEGVEVVIPAGALEEDTEIEISRGEEGQITDLFYLKPEGLKFLKPVSVAIPYKEEATRLNYWSGDPQTQKTLSFTIDREAKKLRTRVMEF